MDLKKGETIQDVTTVVSESEDDDESVVTQEMEGEGDREMTSSPVDDVSEQDAGEGESPAS